MAVLMKDLQIGTMRKISDFIFQYRVIGGSSTVGYGTYNYQLSTAETSDAISISYHA